MKNKNAGGGHKAAPVRIRKVISVGFLKKKMPEGVFEGFTK